MYAKINLKNLFCNLKYLSLYKRYREKYIVCMLMHKKVLQNIVLYAPTLLIYRKDRKYNICCQ